MTAAMDGADALGYLFSFPDWERGTAASEETYTLDRMKRLLEVLGHPERSFAVVHVVGTKGKGSTAAMIAAGLRAAGLSTGLFTSPHLVSYAERFRVDGAMIAPAELAAIVLERLMPAVEALRAAGERTPLHFELQCALACEHFARRGCRVAVVEAGLGGRLDATNALPETDLTVITTIGYDHMAVLGETLAAIAAEKAAVVRPGVRVLSAAQPSEAMAVVERVCTERGAALETIGRQWRLSNVVERRESTRFDLSGPDRAYRDLSIPLAGAHQAANGALAAAALTALGERFDALDEAAIRAGLAGTRWAGRMQTVARDPLILLDGAHNRESAVALAAALTRLYPAQPFVLVLAMFRDKDVSAILRPLLGVGTQVVATSLDHPRALPADELAAATRGLGATVDEAPTVSAALDMARRLAGTKGRVLVTGSLRTVGEALALLEPGETAPSQEDGATGRGNAARERGDRATGLDDAALEPGDDVR